jgi:hypothetical protein
MEGIWKQNVVAVKHQKKAETFTNNFHNHVIILEVQLKEEQSKNEEPKKTVKEIEESQITTTI